MNKSERDKLREHAEMPTRDMISLSHHQVLELLDQLDRYESALRYYSHGSNWSVMGGGAYADIGNLAREALWEEEK